MDIKTIDKNMADSKKETISIKWYNSSKKVFTMHGLYWYKENKNFHRLRDSLETRENLRALSNHPSGAFISFQTDSTSISLRVKNASAAYMAHMSACGQGGLDLYYRLPKKNKYIFLTTTKINKAEYEITMIKDMNKGMKQFRLYLPLYIELKELEIGLDSTATLEASDPLKNQSIICYGTSISQGGCATRPGMNYSSILGRLLKEYEVYNFGFSGNGHLDYEVAEDIATISNMKYLIMESESNNTYERTQEKLEKFVNIILDKNPNIHVYILSHYPHPSENISKTFNTNLKRQKALHKFISRKLGNRVTYIDGDKILHSLGYEETVDNVHLTDLGFYTVAKFFEKLIRKNDK